MYLPFIGFIQNELIWICFKNSIILFVTSVCSPRISCCRPSMCMILYFVVFWRSIGCIVPQTRHVRDLLLANFDRTLVLCVQSIYCHVAFPIYIIFESVVCFFSGFAWFFWVYQIFVLYLGLVSSERLIMRVVV